MGIGIVAQTWTNRLHKLSQTLKELYTLEIRYSNQNRLDHTKRLKNNLFVFLQKYLRIFQHEGCRISNFYYKLIIQGVQNDLLSQCCF